MVKYYTESELEELQRSRSILPELFDFLSRPSRGVAEGTVRALEGEGLGGFVSGIGAGLKGDTYASGKDVVETAFGEDTPDWLSSTLGFGFDVFADPLTYTSVGLKKGTTPRAALQAQAARKADELYEAKAAGRAIPAQYQKFQGKTSGYEELVKGIADDLAADSAGYAYLSFGGKPILKSTKVYDKLSKGAKNLFTNDEGEYGTLSKAFSRQAEMPGGLADVTRRAEMRATEGMRIHQMKINRWASLFTPEQRRAITFALDEADSPVASALPSSKAADNEYGIDNAADMQNVFREFLDQIYRTERNLGILGPDQKVESYAHRVIRNRKGAVVIDGVEKFPVKTTGRSKQPFQYKREGDLTLAEAERLGLDPIVDWAEWLPIRLAQHHQAVAKARVYQDALATFGVRKTKRNADFLEKYNYLPVNDVLRHPMFKNFKDQFEDLYMPVEQMKALESTMGIFDDTTVASKVMRTADKALNEWRFLATLTPQTRIRNLISDIVMNASDGVYNPERYSQARKVIEDIDKFVEADLKGLTDFKGRTIQIGNRKISTRDIWELYTTMGGKAGQISSLLYRDIVGLDKLLTAESGKRAAIGQKLGKPYGKMKGFAGDLADKQEDFVRLAHFMDRLDKDLPKNIKEIKRNKLGGWDDDIVKTATGAGDAVRRVNLDYGNKTVFEKKVMSRVIPFYSYMRQALPQQISLLFTNPGFMALYPKGQNLITNLLGADMADPEEDPLVPQWMTEMAPFRLQAQYQKQNQKSGLQELLDKAGPVGSVVGGAFGIQPGQDVMMSTAGLPVDVLRNIDAPVQVVQDLAQRDIPSVQSSVGETARIIAGQSNPLIKNFVERSTGKSVFTGQDLSEQGWGRWLTQQLPQSNLAYNLGRRGIDPSTDPGVGGFLKGALSGGELGRFLTGLDIRTVTEGQQVSEAIRRQEELEKILSEMPREKVRNRWVYEDPNAKDLLETKKSLQKFITEYSKKKKAAQEGGKYTPSSPAAFDARPLGRRI